MNNRLEKTEAMAKGLQTANQGKQQIIHLEIKSISAAADVVQVSLVLMERFFFWLHTPERWPSLLSAELEVKLEASQSAQEQLEERLEQTAAEVEEVKTTVSKGKTV